MRRVQLLASGCLLTLLACAPSAGAGVLTIGSDLSASAATSIADANLIEAHGQDTAFWPLTAQGHGVEVPEDGQVVSVKIKGTVFRERGAADPANLIHFQSLSPAAPDGSRQVYLTSQGFSLPIDQPNVVSTFAPENLCIKQGGVVAFNDIGGFAYGGALDAPLDPDHYRNGAPFGVFGIGRDSATARFSGDNATKNGATFTTTGANESGPGGTIRQGQELLMQVVVATGMDRSEPCGGPRRHPDGTLVQTGPAPSYMKVVSANGRPQQPYVTKDRRFQTGVYCGGTANPTCSGTALVMLGKRVIARAPFSIPAMHSGRIPMRLTPADQRRLESKGRRLSVTYVLQATFGTFTTPLTLKR